MLLLLPQDLANVFGECVLLQRLALNHTLAVRTNRLGLVVEVRTQHLPRIVGLLDGQRMGGRRPAEVVDLLGDCQRVLQFLARMYFQAIAVIRRNSAPITRFNTLFIAGLSFVMRIA